MYYVERMKGYRSFKFSFGGVEKKFCIAVIDFKRIMRIKCTFKFSLNRGQGSCHASREFSNGSRSVKLSFLMKKVYSILKKADSFCEVFNISKAFFKL